jgi:hypothetical protein
VDEGRDGCAGSVIKPLFSQSHLYRDMDEAIGRQRNTHGRYLSTSNAALQIILRLR